MAEGQVYIHRLLQALQHAGASVVIRHGGQDVSGNQFCASIFQYARVLRAMGVGRGTLLAMFARNRPEALALRYAAHTLGAATVYLSIPTDAAQRRALVSQLAPDLLVVFPETVRYIELDLGLPFATVGIDHAGSKGRLDLLATSVSADPLPVEARADDLAVIASSGGSTGVPKGSCRSFAVYSAMVGAPSPKDRIQLVNGQLAYLSQALADVTLLGGGYVVFRDAYDAADTLAAIEAEKITDLFLVEPQLFELMDHPDLASRDLSSLRSLTHIGASAPKSLRRRARERLGPILVHVYGASETGVVSVLPPGDHENARSDLLTAAGRVLPHVDIRFSRPDGSLSDPAAGGVIEVRSPGMASGYRNNPALGSRSFRDGWYVTGDVGRIDADGYLHIQGRAVDLLALDLLTIDRGAIGPTELEDVLCQLPSVRYAVVVVDPEAKLTIAAVVAWPSLSVDEDDCRRIIGERFGDALAASLRVIPVDRVPLTEQGKPDRMAIRRLASGPQTDPSG